MHEIQCITRENFEPFGWLLDFSENPTDERFEVVVKEEVNPWRIVMFRVRIKEIDRLESHPESMESFEPVSGYGVLIVAPKDAPEDYQVFLLNCPICLKKGIWHEVITLSEESIFKITENKEVSSKFHSLNKRLGLAFLEK